MVNTNAISVFKKVWPTLLCCFFVYFVSMCMFPGVFISVDPVDEWYSTIVILLWGVGDFTSRVILMIRPLRPGPLVCVIGTVSRLVIVPFVALCVSGTIKGHWLPYIAMTILGLTNGYFGAMSMIHCARTPTLSTAGERSIAGIMCGIFLQLGLAIGSNIALAINLVL